MIFLGVDPGLSGALAFWHPETRGLDVFDMPVLELGKKRIDGYELARLVDTKCGDIRAPRLCLLEQVGARPGAGVSGMFNFGRSFGLVEGVISAQFWPLEFAMPHVWKRVMSCPKEKDGARARASQLLPEHTSHWALKKWDGRAEAALLALYAERLHRERGMAK